MTKKHLLLYFTKFFLVLLALSSSSEAVQCKKLLQPQKAFTGPQILRENDLSMLFDSYEVFNFGENPLTLGIEVEGFIPQSSSRSFIRELILSEIKKIYPEAGAHLSGSSIHYKLNGEVYTYAVVNEITMSNAFDDKAVEIKSPILRTQSDLEVFLGIVTLIKEKTNFQEAPEEGGVHIHTGVPFITPSEIIVLAYVFSLLEDELYLHFGVRKRRQMVSAQKTSNYIEKLIFGLLQIPNTDFLYAALKIDNGLISKNFGLNLITIVKYGTAEWRLFNSTADREKISDMVTLASSLIKGIRLKDEKLVSLILKSADTGILSLEEVKAALGFELSEPFINDKN